MKFTKSSKFYSIPVYEFNLPAGHTCPGAKDCLTKTDRETGKQWKSPDQKFRCYAAVSERYPAVRKNRWENYDEIKRLLAEDKDYMHTAKAILAAIPEDATHIRIHGSGDFFDVRYFDAWMAVCANRKDIKFWAFTKSIPVLLDYISIYGELPSNITIQASRGSIWDDLAKKHNLKYAEVFLTHDEAVASGLPIDFDDTLAMSGVQSFALIDNFSDYSKKRLKKINSAK